MDKEKKDFSQNVKDHRLRLEKRITDHMKNDENARSTSTLNDMVDCWDKLHGMEQKLSMCVLDPEDIHEWMDKLKNSDGTTGPHWKMDQTTAAGKMVGVMMGHITQEDFWAAMNMMYSDYSAVADKFNANKPEFFAELAKSFLFDKDGPAPEKKLAAYYRSIASQKT